MNVAKEPRSLKAWAQLAYLFDMYLFSDEAIVCYQAAETLERTNWAWPYLRGSLLLKSAHPEDALPSLERAADLAPHPAARAKLADFLMALGRVDSAEQHYKRVLAVDAKNTQALFGLAQVASARGDLQSALQHLQNVAKDSYLRKRACASARRHTSVWETIKMRPKNVSCSRPCPPMSRGRTSSGSFKSCARACTATSSARRHWGLRARRLTRCHCSWTPSPGIRSPTRPGWPWR